MKRRSISNNGNLRELSLKTDNAMYFFTSESPFAQFARKHRVYQKCFPRNRLCQGQRAPYYSLRLIYFSGAHANADCEWHARDISPTVETWAKRKKARSLRAYSLSHGSLKGQENPDEILFFFLLWCYSHGHSVEFAFKFISIASDETFHRDCTCDDVND